jgi:hypothetical protein
MDDLPQEYTHVIILLAGNICRSPIAEAVFQHLLTERGETDQVWLTRYYVKKKEKKEDKYVLDSCLR